LLRKQIIERKKFILFINNEGILKRKKKISKSAHTQTKTLTVKHTPMFGIAIAVVVVV
jgi:hypothetical protein